MKYGLVFLLLAFACAIAAIERESTWARLGFASGALCALGMGLGFLWLGPRVFIKRRSGRLHPLSYCLYWPYHAVNAISILAVARWHRENAVDEVLPNLFLGRHLTTLDRGLIELSGFGAILDLTSEFARCLPLRGRIDYLCIPVLDTYAPTVQQLRQGVAFIEERIGAQPVFVHCAMGHGRSATFVAAYLLHSGHVATVEAAEALIKRKRPRVGLSTRQRAAVEAFLAELRPAPVTLT
jgi:hypothetical protein